METQRIGAIPNIVMTIAYPGTYKIMISPETDVSKMPGQQPNIAIGQYALQNITSGNNNIGIGSSGVFSPKAPICPPGVNCSPANQGHSQRVMGYNISLGYSTWDTPSQRILQYQSLPRGEWILPYKPGILNKVYEQC